MLLYKESRRPSPVPQLPLYTHAPSLRPRWCSLHVCRECRSLPSSTTFMCRRSKRDSRYAPYPFGPQLYNFRGSMTRPACSIHSGSFVRAPLGTAHASSFDLWAKLWSSMDFHHLGNNIAFLNLLVLPTDWDLSGRENALLYLPICEHNHIMIRRTVCFTFSRQEVQRPHLLSFCRLRFLVRVVYLQLVA